MDKNLIMARQIAEAVEKAGGRTYFVGGCVRDKLMDIDSKDIDIEIHGISVSQLTEILKGFGQPLEKGASFGVMGLSHYDLDIAMPRAEKATGKGHRDFDIQVDPFIGPEKAASRRDFTVNALMENVLTGEILDFFDGEKDIEAKIIRHVSDAHFAEDPLRVFRAAQFAARFNFSIDPSTIALCGKVDLTPLSGERVMGELEKALLKARRPSLFFENLKAMDQLDVWFPEIKATLNCPQDPIHHPEGDVWNHTMQVLDETAKLRAQAQDPKVLMFAALCHDLGKPLVTTKKDGRIHAYDHEKAGLSVTENFLNRLTSEKALKRNVLNMIQLHMQPNMKATDHAKTKSFMKLFDASHCPEDLLLLAKADFFGQRTKDSDNQKTAEAYLPIEKELQKQLSDYHKLMALPYVMGRDLIAAGISPGPHIAEGLAYAHKLRLAGLPKEEQLRQTLGMLRKKQKNDSEGSSIT